MEATQLELFPKEEMQEQVKQDEVRFSDAEWCFQFFEDEPVVFAWSAENDAGDLVLTVSPTDTSNITFINKGMSLKIFARPISDETKLLREQNKQQQ